MIILCLNLCIEHFRAYTERFILMLDRIASLVIFYIRLIIMSYDIL